MCDMLIPVPSLATLKASCWRVIMTWESCQSLKECSNLRKHQEFILGKILKMWQCRKILTETAQPQIFPNEDKKETSEACAVLKQFPGDWGHPSPQELSEAGNIHTPQNSFKSLKPTVFSMLDSHEGTQTDHVTSKRIWQVRLQEKMLFSL